MSHSASTHANPVATITTSVGDLTLEVHADIAPAMSNYFLELVGRGALDGTVVYRSTRLGATSRAPLIQGGPLGPLFTDQATHVVPPDLTFPTDFESTDTSGLRHERGTVSFARDLLETGAVIPDFFICLDDYPELDAGGRTEPDARGFPSFGTVTSGLAVADQIAAGQTSGTSLVNHLAGEILQPTVDIISVTTR